MTCDAGINIEVWGNEREVPMDVVLGSVPQWLSACGSLLALGFAAAAVVATHRTLRIERERDRINAEARAAREFSMRRAQAALVSAWWGQSPDGRWGVFLRNASEAPIYQAYLTVLGPDDRSGGIKAYHIVVPPSREALFCLVGTELPLRTAGRRVKLGFTDAAGIRWLRDQYGRLTELQSNMRMKADEARAAVLSQFKEDFLATYGVTVAFEIEPLDSQREFVADFYASSGADALICPHDWIGDLIARDVIEPTILSADHRETFPEWALNALSVGGLLYGLPMTVDTVALIRNTELAPRQPATFDELITMGTALRDMGRVDEVFAVRVGERGDPFQIWPLFNSAGGWLFGHAPNGEWDPTQIGLATPESIAALNRLRALGEAGSRLIRRSMDRTEALELFTSGRSPFLLTTSDAMPRIRKAGLHIDVSAVPPFTDGRPAIGFTLVHGLVINKHGANKLTAHDLFADYLARDHVKNAFCDYIDAPVALCGTKIRDPAIQQFLALCEAGTLMPSLPQMNATWRILEDMEVAVIAGASAEASAREAAARLTAIFATEERNPYGGPVVA